jgi:lipid-A-disaccharide synthase
MPVIMELMSMLGAQLQGTELCLIAHGSRQTRDLKEEVQGRACVVGDNRYQTMKNCDLLVTTSGTATFEAALLDVPQLFFNRPSVVDYHIFRRFLRVNEYNLANIHFGRKVVPSYVGRDRRELVKSLYDMIVKHMRSERNKPRDA